MSIPPLPPLKISAADGSFSHIPVFEISVSGGVLTKQSATKVQLAISGAQGPSGPPGATIVYAPTGGPYISFATDGTLTAEKVLTASDNITIVTDGTRVMISATTNAGGSSVVYAPTGGNYITFALDAALSNEKVLQASNATINITTDATGFYISANTGGGAAASGSGKIIIGQGVVGTSATRYGAPYGSIIDAAQTSVDLFKLPFDGIAKNLYFAVQTSGGAPSSARGWIGQVWKGTAVTALSANCFEVIDSASDLTNTVSFSAGDTISFGYERTGTASGPGFLSISIEFDPT